LVVVVAALVVVVAALVVVVAALVVVVGAAVVVVAALVVVVGAAVVVVGAAVVVVGAAVVVVGAAVVVVGAAVVVGWAAAAVDIKFETMLEIGFVRLWIKVSKVLVTEDNAEVNPEMAVDNVERAEDNAEVIGDDRELAIPESTCCKLLKLLDIFCKACCKVCKSICWAAEDWFVIFPIKLLARLVIFQTIPEAVLTNPAAVFCAVWLICWVPLVKLLIAFMMPFIAAFIVFDDWLTRLQIV
jgi:hypothetical protein